MHLDEIGGTGPFGEGTRTNGSAKWVNGQALELQLRPVLVSGAGDPGDWFDIHAGL